MQMLIDTATDDPAHIYAQAKMLLSLFETVPAVPKQAGPQASIEGLKLVGVTPIVTVLPDAPPPPPPPPPSVTTATAPAGSTGIVTSGGADALLDSAGVKWDAKLHTSTKTKTIDGKWKPRKPRDGAPPPVPPVTNVQRVPVLVGPNAGTFNTTENLPAPPPVPPSMALPPPPPPPTVLVPSAVDDEPDAPIESDDTGGSNVVPPGAPEGIDFATFIVQITSAMNTGEITQARIHEVQTQFGLTSLFSLNEAESAKLQDVARAFGFVS